MNTPKFKVLGSVLLYSSGNKAGGWIFVSLATWREIHRNKWVELPVWDEVLERIKNVAIQEEHSPISAIFFLRVGKW